MVATTTLFLLFASIIATYCLKSTLYYTLLPQSDCPGAGAASETGLSADVNVIIMQEHFLCSLQDYVPFIFRSASEMC